MKALYSILLFLSSYIYTISAFAHGPPPSTCLTMFPKHSHAEQQVTPCPYFLTLSSTTYNPSQEITLTVDNPEGIIFKGFQIRARRVRGDTETVLGRFTSYPESTMKAYSCLGGPASQIIHKSNVEKTNLTLIWRAPENAVGDIVFTATILATYKEFWTDVRSDILRDMSGSGDEGSLQQIANVDPEINLEKTCGKSKGCFLFPRQCMGRDCDVAVSYETVGNTIQFEMLGRAEGWISVGFSQDKVMGGDETISCTAQGSRVTIQRGYNPALHNERQYTAGLTNMSTIQKEGKLFCRFTRPMIMKTVSVISHTPTELLNRSFDLSQDWYMMMGWGYTYEDTDVMGKHEELPAVTQNKVNFKTYVIYRGSVFPQWLQAHACLMIVAWMLLVGLGTVLARHYRDGNIGGKMIFGQKRWFQFHRLLVGVAACCTAVGFIIVFVKVGDWSEDALLHAYLGIAIMAATTLQVFLGMIRPNAASSIRPIFNWVHRIFGKLIHMAVAAEFILAFDIPLLPAGMKWLGFILVITWICVEVFFAFVLEIVRCCLSRKSSKEDFELSNQFKLEEKYPEKTSKIKNIILLLYVVTIVSLTVAGLCAVLLY